jgi:acetone carboxylase gamma subunit
MNPFYLYIVEHPVGIKFIGVAHSFADAQEHWGTAANIKEVETDEEVIDLRAKGQDLIFLAI